MYNEIDIYDFLKCYKNQKLVYIPNPGNAGDSIIVYGTLAVFNKIGLEWEIGDINKIYNNKLLLYGGGGNLVGIYPQCKNFINKNKSNNKIILLPHTIKSVDELIINLNDNIILICREKLSYDYVYKIIKNKNNLYLSKDMAFYITKDFLDKFKNIHSSGSCNSFRLDSEKTNIIIPKDNNDLSATLRHTIPYANTGLNTTNIDIMTKVTYAFFDYLSKYDVINTNRLHIAIAGCLLGKQVNLYANSYWKNKAIYEYSLKELYPQCRFHN
tara:strand:+ start:326 stop:1135 length:810 start_codon:yes stop_codon:yes gene_type:complete